MCCTHSLHAAVHPGLQARERRARRRSRQPPLHASLASGPPISNPHLRSRVRTRRVRALTSDGNLFLVAGSGAAGVDGSGAETVPGPSAPLAADIHSPKALALDYRGGQQRLLIGSTALVRVLDLVANTIEVHSGSGAAS